MTDVADGEQVDALLDYLKRSRGFDFSAYKRASLVRRIQKRMHAAGIPDFADYTDYLEVHPDEFGHLFNTILINVTSFFRDPEAWNYLATQILPHVVTAAGLHGPIRIWSAGCASGEEAYTLAILLAENLGAKQFRGRVKIYASDVDEEALNQARHGAYSAQQVQDVPPALLERYFEPAGDRYVFQKDLRRSVIFGRHDLVQDAPISRISLLVCRNTLMYLNREMQETILGRFHFALKDSGFLFVGKAEMLVTHAALFTPVDLKWRVFTKVPQANVRDRAMITAHAGSDEDRDRVASDERALEVAFEVDPLAQLIVGVDGTLRLANERARALFGLTAQDVGRPLQDLEMSYRPVELRSRLEHAYAQRRPITLKDIFWPTTSGEARFLEIHVVPLLDSTGRPLGVKVVFVDVTRAKKLQEELQHSKEELETAYEELQSTNEELETTNEELQSTNEELETMNEELQSTNEELETLNAELRQRGNALNDANALLESILSGLRAAVVVVNRDMHILVWNRTAEDLWGLRRDEVQGHHFLHLDIGVPVEQLRQSIRACLALESQFMQESLACVNRRGKPIRCTVTCTPLIAAEGENRGAILLMEEQAPTP